MGEQITGSARPEPKRVYGKGIGNGICWKDESDVPEAEKTHDSLVNTITLGVHYHDVDDEYIGRRIVTLTPSKIGNAMREVFKEEVAEAAAQEPPIEVGAEGYPEEGDAEATFTTAADMVAAGTTAAQIVNLMATHATHKKWGQKILLAEWNPRKD